MRELTYEEMEQIDGGVAPIVVGIAIAAGTGAVTGYDAGGWGGAAVGATLAVPAAIFTGAAVSAYGVGRLMFGAYSIGTAWLQNRAVNQIGQANGS